MTSISTIHCRRLLLACAFITALCGLMACADMSKSECQQADWRALGQQDAMSGQTLARFERRSDACRKNNLSADRAQYEAGHAQGTLQFCSADRGRSDGADGQPPSAVCSGPVGDRYRQGHASGLQQFCTAPSGYEVGRKGQSDRQVCPPDLAPAFQIGFRMGQEWYGLNQRLAEIQKAGADDRALLADPKTPADRREAANRHLGQLDADEAATRKLIRQAEFAALSLSSPTGQPVAVPAPVAAPVSAEWLVGQWRLSSLSFKTPVDLNRDGVRSPDAMSELSPCQRDRQLDLEGDQRATVRTGGRTPGCRAVVRTYQWRTDDGMWQDVHTENGRRVVTERPVLYLNLRGGRDDEAVSMVVESVDPSFLIVRTDMPDGSDSTREAVATYRRVRR